MEYPCAAFLDVLNRSRLVDREFVDQLAREAKATGAGLEQLVERLIADGVLTHFQVKKLLAGRWQGLVVAHYRLLSPIGRGGMGVVYLALDMRPPRAAGQSTVSPLAAIKVLPPKRAQGEPRALARFQREMAIGLGIPAHAGLVKTRDAGQDDNVCFLAMDYAMGRTVKQIVVDTGVMSVPTAARVFADAAAGLHTLHLSGYIHRDIKPSNIMVSPDGRGQVLDFGFAIGRGEKPPDDPTVLGGHGYTMGTIDYLPPEQARNATAVSAETDIYSLGCSLYYALSASPPFPTGDVRDKIRDHRSRTPTPLTIMNPAVPEEFARLVAWMMSKKPENRPSTAAETAAELDRWATPAPTQSSTLHPVHDPSAIAAIIQEVEDRWLESQGDVTLKQAVDEGDMNADDADADELVFTSRSIKTSTQLRTGVKWRERLLQSFDVAHHPLQFFISTVLIIVMLITIIRIVLSIIR